MSNIELLLQNKELNQQQIALYEKYQQSTAFQACLAPYFYYELPSLLDYFILKELELGDLSDTFNSILNERAETLQNADQILKAFEQESEWSQKLNLGAKNALTTKQDLQRIYELCQELTRRELDAKAVLIHFFEYLVQAKSALLQQAITSELSLADAMDFLPDNWYSEPWYYIYVQYFGTDKKGIGGFEQLIGMLDYLEALSIKNIYILPHYESPNGDAGYDISNYQAAEAYGGVTAFRQFMKVAISRGFRVATDLVFNHCSVEHHWFQQALKGNSQYFRYFLKCPANWKAIEIEDILKDEAGDLYLYLPERDNIGNKVTSKRILIFPDVDQTLWLEQEVKGLAESILFYREFYPFQVDMDIQEPLVVKELFHFLAEELEMGILGKRTDAIAHWVKAPGTNAKNLPATYALQQLIKQFLKHVNPKTIILPEVVTTSKELKTYAGDPTLINGHLTTTGGDALLDFQLQGMLREMIYFQKTTPFWTQVFQLGELGKNTSVPLVPIEHHDETYMGFIHEIEAMRSYLKGSYTYLDKTQRYQKAKRGIVYKNGMSAGARYADALNQDVRRIANAFFCLYLLPGTPVLYYGTEIGASNQWDQMERRQQAQFDTLLQLLGPELVGPDKAIDFEKCEDPRELQRGPIPAEHFYEAIKKAYPAVRLVQELNRLRNKHSALRSYQISAIDTYHESILGMIRYPSEPEGPNHRPFLAFSNLCERPVLARVPFAQLQQLLSTHQVKLTEQLYLFGKHPLQAELMTQGRSFDPGLPEHLEIALAPYSALLFEVETIR